MRAKVLAITLIAIVAVVGGWSAVACGDDGDGALTLEEFFAEVEALDDEFETRSAELEAEFDALSEDEALERAPDLLRRQVELIEEFVDDLDAIEAPDEAADIISEAVSAGREGAELFSQQLDAARDAASLEELFAALESAELDAAFQRFEQACFDAEALATENNITIDLDCEDE